jgi:serine/threonine protein kinase
MIGGVDRDRTRSETDEHASLSPGQRVADRFRLVRSLGAGGMGEVWEAEDEKLGRRVALKRLSPGTQDEVAEARFAREARAAAQLRHPNVVSVHDVLTTDEGRFLVMELASGRTLRDVLESGARDDDASLRCLRGVASALRALHGCGIVHRDVKPENVIVREDGSACLVDLGIAKWINPALAPTDASFQPLTAEEFVVGTPDYLPPEARFAGVHDERGDQWAWGTLAYELLSGVHPRDVAERPLSELTGAPAEIVSIVERARARAQRDRFPSMHEIVTALDAALGPNAGPRSSPPRAASMRPTEPLATSEPPPARPRRKGEAAPRANARWVFLLAVVGTALTGGLVIALVLALRGKPPPSARPPKSAPPLVASAAPDDADAAIGADGQSSAYTLTSPAAPDAGRAGAVAKPKFAATMGGECTCVQTYGLPYLCPVEVRRRVVRGRCMSVNHSLVCARPGMQPPCPYAGHEGDACAGYDSTGAHHAGRIEGASACPDDADSRWTYKGKTGDDCRGVDSDGKVVSGHLLCPRRR